MKIRFKKLVPAAVAPRRMSDGAAGFDLTAIEVTWNNKSGTYDYKTGIAVEIPKGFAGLVFSRSSVYKTGSVLSNGVGVIDSDYRGDIGAKFVNVKGDKAAPYWPGERVMQLVIVPVPEVEFVEADELSETERGTGGYGSTGL